MFDNQNLIILVVVLVIVLIVGVIVIGFLTGNSEPSADETATSAAAGPMETVDSLVAPFMVTQTGGACLL